MSLSHERLPDGWVSVTIVGAKHLPDDLQLRVSGQDDIEFTTISLTKASRYRATAIFHAIGHASAWHLVTPDPVNDAVQWRIDVVELTTTEASLREAAASVRARRWGPRDAWRLGNKALGVLKTEGVGALLEKITGRRSSGPDAVTYARWIDENEPRDEASITLIRSHITTLENQPKISVVMPVYNTQPEWLDRAIKSVREQFWSNWELCIADDASTRRETREVLERHAAEDSRVRVVYRKTNGHISESSNSAVALATGDYIALLDHDDELPRHALYVIADAIRKNPEAVILYSDEDKIDENGRRFDPYFKPDWNPELFSSQNYVSHLGVYRRDVVQQVGGFRKGLEGSQDYDLALRVSERARADQIIHVPYILYHWRAIPGSTALAVEEKSYAVQAARRAVHDHFARRGMAVSVEAAGPNSQYQRIRYAVPIPAPSVTIVVCTRDRVELLRTAIDSIERLTAYPSYEILIVDNGSKEVATKQYFEEISKRPRIKVIRYDAPFNFAAMNNFAARQSSADICVLLNNDIEVITPEWLTELVSHAARPDVGCVGAMLYYPNGRIQHAGVILGINGVAAHVHRLMRRGSPGYFSRAMLTQSYSVVTAACLAVRREVFWEVGGLDETLAVAFNDVDFCIKVREHGYRNVWTPYAELYHYESASRGSDMAPEQRERFKREVALMQRRWGALLANDPAYNPNLRLDDEYFGLARRTRAPKPWLLDGITAPPPMRSE